MKLICVWAAGSAAVAYRIRALVWFHSGLKASCSMRLTLEVLLFKS